MANNYGAKPFNSFTRSAGQANEDESWNRRSPSYRQQALMTLHPPENAEASESVSRDRSQRSILCYDPRSEVRPPDANPVAAGH